jgi:hypothetical protein
MRECERLQGAIVELARASGELSSPDQEAAQAHVATCSACAARLEEQRRLSAGLGRLAAHATRLAVGSDPGAARLVQAARRRRSRRAMAWSWRVAAALAAVALGVVALSRPEPGPAREREIVFSALRDVDPLRPGEGGQLVRASLGRAELFEIGVPTDGLGERDRLWVELIVGADGIPRAFRPLR